MSLGGIWMPITALYAGLLAPLFVLLSIRVIAKRRRARIGIGHGEDLALLRRMRVHANFAEYVPLALLLMALAESMQGDARVLHALGLTLAAGRVVHAFGVSQAKENLSLRVTGMSLTFAVIALAAFACLWLSASRLLLA